MEDGNLMNKLNIVYEDNHLLVVEKPINIPVQEDSSNNKDLLTILKGNDKIYEFKMQKNECNVMFLL